MSVIVLTLRLRAPEPLGERNFGVERHHLGSTALLLDQVIHYGLKLDLQEGPHLR
jgi:hypothetical protein